MVRQIVLEESVHRHAGSSRAGGDNRKEAIKSQRGLGQESGLVSEALRVNCRGGGERPPKSKRRDYPSNDEGSLGTSALGNVLGSERGRRRFL